MLVAGAAVAYVVGVVRRRYASRERVLTRVAVGVCAAVLVAGMTKSAFRTRVWRDNETLFSQAVIDSPLAYRAHYMLGAWHFDKKHQRAGESEFRKALSLFPYDPFLSYNMAEQYRMSGSCKVAIPFYQWTVDLDPNLLLGQSMFSWCLLAVGRYADARTMATNGLRLGGDKSFLKRVIAAADSATGVVKQIDSPSVALNRPPSKVPDSVQKAARKLGGGSTEQ
jgi:hypothetical protein